MKDFQPRIILTGFMAAGKTTVAEALSQALLRRAVDLDHHIVAREGRTIQEIIEQDGEERFRERETAALRLLLEDSLAHIIALGGGTWTMEKNRALIKEHGCFTVWLDAPFDFCWQRIEGASNLRPLARDKESTRELYRQRRASYALARLHLSTEGKSPRQIATEIIRALPGDVN